MTIDDYVFDSVFKTNHCDTFRNAGNQMIGTAASDSVPDPNHPGEHIVEVDLLRGAMYRPVDKITVELPAPVVRIAETFCGCGNPEAAWQTVRDYLHNFSLRGDDWSKRQLPSDPTGEQWIVVYLLDHWKLTEHGTGIFGSWLTDDGEIVLEFLNKWTANWQESDSAEFIDKDGTCYSVCS